jgi:hypothetical protein
MGAAASDQDQKNWLKHPLIQIAGHYSSKQPIEYYIIPKTIQYYNYDKVQTQKEIFSRY